MEQRFSGKILVITKNHVFNRNLNIQTILKGVVKGKERKNNKDTSNKDSTSSNNANANATVNANANANAVSAKTPQASTSKKKSIGNTSSSNGHSVTNAPEPKSVVEKKKDGKIDNLASLKTNAMDHISDGMQQLKKNESKSSNNPDLKRKRIQI